MRRHASIYAQIWSAFQAPIVHALLLMGLVGLVATAHADPWPFAARQLQATLTAVPADRYPHYAASAWTLTGASAWTSGFFPGTLWAMYYHTGDPMWRAEAEAQQKAIEAQKTRTTTHDLGFMFFPSYVNAYRLTNHDAYRQIAVIAATNLDKRYKPAVGVIHTAWPGSETGEVKTIIDIMVNLELLFWASQNGGPSNLAAHAHSHALRSATDHVRSDGSTYHVVTYNDSTGAVKSKTTAQGYNAESTWARGQAWAIYGFTMAYRYTGDTRLLNAARLVADYWMSHLPPDDVPYWDFEAPNLTTQPHDSSAAAIATSGLLDFAQIDPDAGRRATYLAQAQATLNSLASVAYLAQGTSTPSLLRHGAQGKGGQMDVGLIYGDYYFLEALIRAEVFGPQNPPPAVINLAPKAVIASSHDGNVPQNTLDNKPSTRWSANGDGQWIRFDLGATKTVSQLDVAWYQGNVRRASFDVQTSGNGTSWTTRWSGQSRGTTTQQETVGFADVSARYVRIVGHGNTINTWNSITEVDIYGR
jgi:unsaturated chondroitin disaccharide hydrolase